MSTLSYKNESGKAFVIAASPIYELADIGQNDDLVFELLTADATTLRRLLGTYQTFLLDEVFSGLVLSLEDVAPSHPATQLLDRPTMRARIRRFDGPSTTQ